MNDIDTLLTQALDQLKQADDGKTVEEIRVRYLGKKGLITQQLKSLGAMSVEDRKVFGKVVNEAKTTLQDAIEDAREDLNRRQAEVELRRQGVDVTLPGWGLDYGSLHPLTRTMRRMESFFTTAGFQVAAGPEIEDDFHNFEALNIPEHHPARDMQDTFYFDGSLLLRTHTSSVQIRQMQNGKPPFRLIAPGRVYRSDPPDPTHSPMFHQVEGLMVDEGVSFANLKGMISRFLKVFFESELVVRFRPSYFPFTEPSAEVDIGCLHCAQKGCRVCSHSGWLEVLGCGMVHPNVFTHVGVDPQRYTGFAFGMGVERLAMLKYGITDIRMFFENDQRVLQQF